MHRDNTGDGHSPLAVVRLSRLAIYIALSLDVFLELLGIHAIGPLVDVNKVRSRACLTYCLRCCDERMWNRKHDVSRQDPGGHQREANGVRPACKSDAMGGVTKPRKLALKFFHHGTAHKPGSSQSLLEDRG